MSPECRGRPSRLLVPIVVSLLGLVGAVGCGGDQVARPLTGIVRDDPLRSDGIIVTDVTDTGAYPADDDSFELVARPGSLLVVYFGYTQCPDICPTTLTEIRTALRRLGDLATRVDLAMITVDPERDTGEILNAYVGSFTEQFHALRPESDDELRTAEAAFLASSSVTRLPDGTVEVGHSVNSYVVDENGTVLVEWPFGHGVDNTAHDLEVMLDTSAS